MINILNFKKLTLISIFLAALLCASCGETSMLKNKPYFTWRIESSGARFEAKLNGIILERNTRGSKIAYEQPVNDYMFSGKNRISVVVYPFAPNDYRESNVKVSLFVNNNDAPDSEKVLLGHIVFTASGHKLDQGAMGSREAVMLNSSADFVEDKDGDVTIYQAEIRPVSIRPGALEIYQDIELETPFPRWGFLDAEPYEFPVVWSEYTTNPDPYIKGLLDPVYDAHVEIYEALAAGDVEKFLDFIDERSTEMDIAYYEPKGTHRAGMKERMEQELASKTHELKIKPADKAPPFVSDNRNLIRLTSDALIYFAAKDESSYHHYQIQMYKKDGKWIVGR